MLKFGEIRFWVAIACLSWSSSFPANKKSLLPIGGARTGIYLRYHLACRIPGRLMTVPTHRLPCNEGKSSEDTEAYARSPCPRRPICCSAFRPALSYAGLSVDAPAALLPPQRFYLFGLPPLNYIFVRLSSTIFHHRRNLPNFRLCRLQEGGYSRLRRERKCEAGDFLALDAYSYSCHRVRFVVLLLW